MWIILITCYESKDKSDYHDLDYEISRQKFAVSFHMDPFCWQKWKFAKNYLLIVKEIHYNVGISPSKKEEPLEVQFVNSSILSAHRYCHIHNSSAVGSLSHQDFEVCLTL